MREDSVFVGLGANLGNPEACILQAFEELDHLSGTHVLARSSLYRSVPVGKIDQPDFINAVARLTTTLDPDQLLEALLAIERQHGRIRAEKNGPRVLDLDLLLYGNRVDTRPHLCLPHPRMHERGFVLLPLNEIAPDCEVPRRGLLADLVAGVTDQGVNRIDVA